MMITIANMAAKAVCTCRIGPLEHNLALQVMCKVGQGAPGVEAGSSDSRSAIADGDTGVVDGRGVAEPGSRDPLWSTDVAWISEVQGIQQQQRYN